MTDGGEDGIAATAADNTLFAKQGLFCAVAIQSCVDPKAGYCAGDRRRRDHDDGVVTRDP